MFPPRKENMHPYFMAMTDTLELCYIENLETLIGFKILDKVILWSEHKEFQRRNINLHFIVFPEFLFQRLDNTVKIINDKDQRETKLVMFYNMWSWALHLVNELERKINNIVSLESRLEHQKVDMSISRNTHNSQ